MANNQQLQETFRQQVQALLSAEKMLTQKIPLLAKKAYSFGLQKGLLMHLAETLQHKTALELIGKELGFNPEGETNGEMESILKEGEAQMQGIESGPELDALIVEGAQQIEEYEIERYTAVADDAEAMGNKAIAARLRLTMEEERQALTKLSFIGKELVGIKKQGTAQAIR